MGQKLYQTIGLPFGTWNQLNDLKSTPLVREVLGLNPDMSEVIDLLIRHGIGSIKRINEKEERERLV